MLADARSPGRSCAALRGTRLRASRSRSSSPHRHRTRRDADLRLIATAEFALRSVVRHRCARSARCACRRSAAVISTSSSASPSSRSPPRVAIWVDRPGPAAAFDRRASLSRRRVRGAARPSSSCPAWRATQRRRLRAAVAALRLAPPARRARSGSAASPACSSSGAACRSARRVAGLVVCVPRFSNVAFVSVMPSIGSGIGGLGSALPDLRLSVADLVRQDPARQDRPAPAAHAARRGQPRTHEASARRLAECVRSSARRPRSCSVGWSAARSFSSPPPIFAAAAAFESPTPGEGARRCGAREQLRSGRGR